MLTDCSLDPIISTTIKDHHRGKHIHFSSSLKCLLHAILNAILLQHHHSPNPSSFTILLEHPPPTYSFSTTLVQIHAPQHPPATTFCNIFQPPPLAPPFCNNILLQQHPPTLSSFNSILSPNPPQKRLLLLKITCLQDLTTSETSPFYYVLSLNYPCLAEGQSDQHLYQWSQRNIHAGT